MRTALLIWLLAMLPNAVLAEDTLRVVFNELRPYTYIGMDGEPAGYGIRLVSALADQIGAQLEFVLVENPGEVVEALRTGTADIAPILARNAEREAAVLFSVPHETIVFHLYALRRRAGEIADRWPDGVRVGFTEGSYPSFIVTRYDQAIAVPASSNTDLLSHVLSGDVDVALYPDTAFFETIELLDTRQRFVAVGDALETVPLRLGITHTRPELADRLNRALSDFIASSEYRTMRHATLGSPYATSDPQVAHAVGAAATLMSLLAGLSLIRSRRQAQRDLFTAAKRTAEVERRAADELREKNAMLLAKNKAMEELIYVVSHDLSSPLVSISGFARGAIRAQGAGQTEKAARMLQRVEANVGSMSSLINGILKVGRIGQETPVPERVSLCALVDGLKLRLHASLAERELELVCTSDCTLWTDRDMLSRVLQNLVENAAKHGANANGQRIEVSSVVQNGRASISIRDFGNGIPENLRPRIFEMYQRRSDSKDGSGLGLTIVARIVEKLGGTVSVSSKPSSGTTFVVDLPHIDQPIAQSA